MFRRLLILPILIISLLLLAAPGAFAHATVVTTSPTDGQLLASTPHQVSVTFDEPVELQFGALRVFAPNGTRVDTGSPDHPAGHADQVAVGLEAASAPGTYTVAWRVVSADSHPVQGAFTFSVGAASATALHPRR
ncbi:copper resistance protein CopC [Catenulispora yoronensis]